MGTGIGRGPAGKKITYAEAWEGFRRSLTSADVFKLPHFCSFNIIIALCVGTLHCNCPLSCRG